MLEKTREKEKEERLRYLENFFKNEKIFTEPNNKVWISGVIEKDFEYAFKIDDEKYYRTRLKVERNSGQVDYIPIAILKTFKEINWREKVEGRKIKIAGQLRTRNKRVGDGKSHLELYVFVTSVQLLKEDEELVPENSIYLKGTICKQPIHRETPLGKVITDLLLAVNRSKNKSDYIPSITWFEDAYRSAMASVGEHMETYGRIQSREYEKNGKIKIAYEVSISEITEISI